MDVYIVPVGPAGHELYSEVPDEAVATPERPAGAWRRLTERFHEVLAAAERERHHPAAEPPPGWMHRIWRRLLRHAAEAIAEQRLLWHLRRQREAALIRPDDLSATEARAILRAGLRRDRDHHRFWLVADAGLAAITGPLFFFVPGPNLIAYYFVFRFIGHYLAWRGARQGLDGVAWTEQASAPLAELRRAMALGAGERDRRVHDVATRLRLAHLAAFVRRTGG